MQFILSKEQREEINREYLGDDLAISIIQERLNEFALEIEEDDFFEIFCSVAFQYECIKNIVITTLQKKKKSIDISKIDINALIEDYFSVDQMILYELDNKYGDDLKYLLPENSKNKIKQLRSNKKRHF